MRSFWIRSMNPMELQIRGPVARPSIHFFGAFRWMPQKPRTHLNSFYSSNIMVLLILLHSHICVDFSSGVNHFCWLLTCCWSHPPLRCLNLRLFWLGFPIFVAHRRHDPPALRLNSGSRLLLSLWGRVETHEINKLEGNQRPMPSYYRVPSGYPSFDS